MPSTVTVVSGGNVMQLYDAKPAGTPKGAVIVMQEAFRITDYIQDVCNRPAAAGYRAVAPHVSHRSGDPVIAYDDMQVVRYPGAGHAFHTEGRDAYHPKSAEDAWKRTLDWLGAHLAKG